MVVTLLLRFFFRFTFGMKFVRFRYLHHKSYRVLWSINPTLFRNSWDKLYSCTNRFVAVYHVQIISIVIFHSFDCVCSRLGIYSSGIILNNLLSFETPEHHSHVFFNVSRYGH